MSATPTQERRIVPVACAGRFPDQPQVYRRFDAPPFTRRIALRIALNVLDTRIRITEPVRVTDAVRSQHCWILPYQADQPDQSGQAHRGATPRPCLLVTDQNDDSPTALAASSRVPSEVPSGVPSGAMSGVVPEVVVDFVADEISGDLDFEVADLLRPLTRLDWEISAKIAWQRWQGYGGMPQELRAVAEHGATDIVLSGPNAGFAVQGTEVVLGRPGSTFVIHGASSTLSRLFLGDALFEELLFNHQIRIVGGLAHVSALIGASMREAFDDFDN